MNFGFRTIRLNKIGLCIIIAVILVFAIYTTSRKKLEQKSKVNLRTLLAASIETALRGGVEIVKVYKSSNLNERSKGKTKEGANDPITNADERSNYAMFCSLIQTFGDIKIFSEEKSSESECKISPLELDKTILENTEIEDQEVLSSEVTIWIDPLDATVEFTEKLLNYVTTMVCVAVKGQPVIGVIHFPFEKEHNLAWAWVGKGISEGLKQLQSKKFDEVNPTVIFSRSHSGTVENTVKKAFGEGVTLIRAGGAGYKSLEVASKNVTAYIHTTQIKKWDICAGNAILNALGGKMTTLNDELIDYKSEKMAVSSGILATMHNHDIYIEKLKPLLNNA